MATLPNQMIIGIDNGISGGLAAISAHHGRFIAATVFCSRIASKRVGGDSGTSSHKQPKPRLERELDALNAVQWILDITNDKPCPIVAEEVPMHANSAVSMRSMAISYGIMRGAFLAKLEPMGYTWHTVRSGNPKDSWQKQMGVYAPGKTKQLALALAKTLWPNADWPTKPKGAIEDGPIDAALIAYFFRLQCSND